MTDPRGQGGAALAEAGAALAAEARRLASFGWMRGTSGNLSVVMSRDPLYLAVTASGADKGELTGQDVVLVDSSGQGEGKPSAEAALHARIAALTGAGAVVHVHPVAAVAAGRLWPSGVAADGLEMLKGIGLAADQEVRIPVVPNSQDMGVLGDDVERLRDPRVPGVVVAGHGLYTWGADIMQARHHTEVIEWLLELALATR
jgi:methylthioribulose-1-phosphate dehydratase